MEERKNIGVTKIIDKVDIRITSNFKNLNELVERLQKGEDYEKLLKEMDLELIISSD